MGRPKKVVDNAEPTPQEEPETTVAVIPADQPQPTEEVVETTTPPEPVTAPPVKEDVDEFGVPWKNRAMEWKRKSEEIVDRLPQIIEDKLKNVNQSKEPTYSYEQLEAYKMQQQRAIDTDPNATASIAWASAEQRKLQLAEQRKLIEDVVGSRDRITKEETLKQKSLEYVQKEYPDAFRKDASGNPIAWDEGHPITQQIFGLMRNPTFAQNPEGLMAAADIAYGRYAKSQSPAMKQKLETVKAEVKQAQKASLTEGAGKKVTVSGTPQQGAIDNLRKTGSMKDAEAAVGAILRARGIISGE